MYFLSVDSNFAILVIILTKEASIEKEFIPNVTQIGAL